MEDDYLKKALHQTVTQFFNLKVKRDVLKKQEMELDREAFALLPKMHALAELCDLRPDSAVGRMMRDIAKSGLTQAVINILEGTGEWMSPIQIRDQMIRFKVDLTRYKNPLSSIHTILTRLVDDGKVEPGRDEKTQRTVFRWVPPFLFSEMGLEENVTPEQLAENLAKYMIDPPKRTGRRRLPKKKDDSRKKIAAKPRKGLLTEGSLKVN